MTDQGRVTIGIVGGTGRMGQWFERFFTGQGHEVLIWGRKSQTPLENLAKTCQAVVLLQPQEASIESAGIIGPLMTPDQALMDMCSLKKDIAEAMYASTDAQVVATHPLFGPNTESMEGQNVIICPMRGESWAEWVEESVVSGGGVVTRCTPDEHDTNMALVQGLTHFMTVVLGRTLMEMGKRPADMLPFATPIFRLKMDLVGRLFDQDLDLFLDLIAQNPGVLPVLDRFLDIAKDTGETFHADRAGKGRDILQNIRDFLGDFTKQGLEESDIFLSTFSGSGGKV